MSFFKGQTCYLKEAIKCFLLLICVIFVSTTGAFAAQQLNTAQMTQVNQVMQQLQQGNITPNAAADVLGGITGGAIDQQALSNLGQNVLGGGVDVGAATELISQVASGNLDSSQILNAIGQVGGGDIGNLVGALQGISGISQMLNQAGSAQNQAAMLNAVSGMISGDSASALANPANASAMAEAISDAFNLPPEVAQILEIALNALGIGSSAAQGQDQGQGQEQGQSDGDYTKPEESEQKNPGQCGNPCGCCSKCHEEIVNNHIKIRTHVTNEFEKHRNWLVTTYFLENILPAMMLMTEQLTAIGVQQVQIIGSFLDAKHQLETQRLLQRLTAEAHKDYQPSEGLCEIGTNMRSLAASERRSDLGHVAFSNRVMARQLLSGDVVSRQGESSDRESRLAHFIETYCDPADNDNGLKLLCQGSNAEATRRNKDVDFTRTVESQLTLDVDFTKDGAQELTDDEEDILALAANLYAHEVMPVIARDFLADDDGNLLSGADDYMDLRAVAAKRSVAQNSFSAITAMKSEGADDVQPFLYKLVQELGVPDDELEDLLGEKPSYFAQMEVLTKKIYQNPVFYTELYDKPVNVDRKGAALQAIGLMQDRDLYRSLLRSEAILAVLLETMLMEEQAEVSNQIGQLKKQSGNQ